jgi:c-di-GMP-binding flagellar brake protein YcgR
VAFLDNPEGFLDQVRRFFPRRARLQPRAPVVLEALLAAADDPGFTAPSRAVILDISSSGGLVMGKDLLEPGGLLRLRIARLSDQAPITAGVCWQGEHGKGHRCAGVRFVEISPRQTEELEGAAGG